ncbi:MAG: hypothetical protein ACRDK3_05750 [Actinomycetota bacterium]
MKTSALKSKPWWWVGIAVLALGGMSAAVFAMTADDDSDSERDAAGPSAGTIGDPEIEQAKWKIISDRTARVRLSKKQRASFKRQRKALNDMTRSVFDALFLSPERREGVLKRNFTPAARKSYERARVGVPRRADDVRIRKRNARIVIDGNSRATIEISIVARGEVGKGLFVTEHRSILYATRNKGWKVFGFSVDQHPFEKAGKATKKDEPKGNGTKEKKHNKRPDKKKRKKPSDASKKGER